MTTKSNRHKMVEVSCEWCGKLFLARQQRIDEGYGRFCSREHWHEHQRKLAKEVYGKDKGKKYWDKRGRWFVHWYDIYGNIHVQAYARWYWEVYVGEVPAGYDVSYKDGKPENIDPSNFECIPSGVARGKGGHKQVGKVVPKESRLKMSESRIGMKLSDEHKKNIGESTKKHWADGVFDNVVFNDISGDKNPGWRGGVGDRYPKEFNKALKSFVKNRDNHICRICKRDVHHSSLGHVHHISGDRNNNHPDNLILLCQSCHLKIHHSPNTDDPEILAFQSRLMWNQNDEYED